MKKLLLAALLAAGFGGAASAEEVTLRFTPLAQPGQASLVEFYQPWADSINAEGKGVVTIDLRPGTSIANITNAYPRVMNGVTHIAFDLFNYIQGKFPLAEVGALPFVAESAEVGSVALWRLYKSGMLDAEFDEAHPLMLLGLPQSLLHLAKPPRSLDDLSGLKVIGATQMTALSAKYLGTTPLTLSSPEVHEAMLRGVADGTVLSWNPYFSFKIGEVAKYHVDAPLGTAAGMLFMSKKIYEALPAAVRKVLDNHSGEAASRAWGKWWDGDNEKGRQAAKHDPNHTVVTLDPAMRAKWSKKLEGAIEEWGRNRPGLDKAQAEFRRLVAEVKAGR